MMRQLLVYEFGPDAAFEGQLVGALERVESGGTLRVVDGLFVRRDAGSGELSAVDLRRHGGATAGVERLLDFRFDERKRRATTERALERDTIRAVADRLEPGAALAALLVEHLWAGVLADAVGRAGGAAVRDELVEASTLGDVLGAGIAG